VGKKEQPLLEEVPKNEAVEMQNVKEQEDERTKLWLRENEKLQERGEKLHQKEEELKRKRTPHSAWRASSSGKSCATKI